MKNRSHPRSSLHETTGKPLADAVRTSTSLDAVPHGVMTRVVAVSGTGTVARRLMEMGVVPGAPIRVVKVAPLGDPIQVCIRDYHLALRRSEAQTITVAASEV